MTEYEIQNAYLEVIGENQNIPYTQAGADFVYAEMKKKLSVGDGVFYVKNISEMSRGLGRDLEFILK